MKNSLISTLVATAQITHAAAKAVPENLQALYTNIQAAGACTGSDLLKGGFYDVQGGPADFGYCDKYVAGTAIYLKGPGEQLANMDVDCDGEQQNLDPRCEASTDTQAQTAFQSEVQAFGISDLNSGIVPYVVLGNYGSYSPTFDPTAVGIQPLSVVAVVCNNSLIYGIWGDTNGDDGPPLVGEASLALATACFGESMNGNNGYDGTDVLYLAFVGDEAVSNTTANWKAANYQEFEESISELGDKLVASLPTITGVANSTLEARSSAAAATASTASVVGESPTRLTPGLGALAAVALFCWSLS